MRHGHRAADGPASAGARYALLPLRTFLGVTFSTRAWTS